MCNRGGSFVFDSVRLFSMCDTEIEIESVCAVLYVCTPYISSNNTQQHNDLHIIWALVSPIPVGPRIRERWFSVCVYIFVYVYLMTHRRPGKQNHQTIKRKRSVYSTLSSPVAIFSHFPSLSFYLFLLFCFISCACFLSFSFKLSISFSTASTSSSSS